MRKYKCPECKKKTMEKKVYTECRCDCGYIEHHPHKLKSKMGKKK